MEKEEIEKKIISKEEVITKLKDDGDFDRLRLKIIRQLKQNEELRSNITSMVKQSAALNSANAEKMKPRQLCDAIHDELCEKMMSQISDSIWEIIRDGNGMKAEITSTVQSVYNQLLNLEGKSVDISPPISAPVSFQKEAVFNGSHDDKASNVTHEDLPGFAPHNDTSNTDVGPRSETVQASAIASRSEDQGRKNHESNNSPQSEDGDGNSPPGFSSLGKRKEPLNVSDEDPDIPPGFG